MKKVRLLKLSQNQEGQSLVEYVILLVVALSIVAIIGAGFRRTIFNLWLFYTKKVAPGCSDGCEADPSIRFTGQ